MFKKGDKMRCLSVCLGVSATVGKIYTAEKNQIHNGKCACVDFIDDRGKLKGMFASRFELVSSASSQTDQDLADDLRHYKEKALACHKELMSRGYKFSINGKSNITWPSSLNLRIFKEECKTIEL